MGKNGDGDEMQPKIGPKHSFPDGKYGSHDEGALVFGLAADPENEKVVLHFGIEVSWIAMSPDQARQLGRALIQKAEEAAAGL
jgi:hypothetical protein